MYGYVCQIWRAGALTPYLSPEWYLGGPHAGVIQSAVHPPDNWSPKHTPLTPLCFFLVDSRPSPALLWFTLMFNPILTVSSFSPRSRSASHEYPKVCLLDRIIPLFKATGDNSSATKNTLNGSSALSLCFFRFPLLSLSLPSVFVPLGFYQTHWSTRSGSSSAALHRLLDTRTHTTQWCFKYLTLVCINLLIIM